MADCDVVVIGAGNAGLCAALAAREKGARVLVIECSGEEERGGNTRFSDGAIRFVYDGVEDLKAVAADLTPEEIARSDFGSYTIDDFYDDMFRVTQNRTDPDLCEMLVTGSLPGMIWLRGKGIRFVPMYGRQAYEVNGRFVFWGGMTLETIGGGIALVDGLSASLEEAGGTILYRSRAISLIQNGTAVTGVRVRGDHRETDIMARAVVLASGGFEANAEWRTRYLGPGWDAAKVRGCRFNTGEGIRMALEAGASSFGNWSGCHAVAWEDTAPEFAEVGAEYARHSYPVGITINSAGKRFMDEGADFRNYTYATIGRQILAQPGGVAWQIFDGQTEHLLRAPYGSRVASRIEAGSLPELLGRIDGLDGSAALREIEAYNAAVDDAKPFDPNVKDGRRTHDLAIPKSNWATRIERPPFLAFRIGCAITYTYGGLRVDARSAQVLANDLVAIPGLYAAGELVGGLFWGNYPGGAGLTAGLVLGRAAGAAAGAAALAS